MKRLTSITPLLVLGASLVAAAEPQGGGGTQGSSTAQAPSTLTGCLRAGEAQNTFVLSVAADPAAGTAAVGASASGDRSTGSSPHATGTTGANAIKTTTYQLTPAQATVDLRRFVGQRVTVTGALDPSSKSTVATSNTAATQAAPDAAPGDQKAPVVTTTEATRVQSERMQVASIKPVGGSCQQ
jgi:hypothetical protein